MTEKTFSPEQRQLLEAIAGELRQAIEHVATLNSDASTLSGLLTQLQAVNSAMAPHAGNKALETFNSHFGDDINSILPCSPTTGRFNPLAPPVALERQGDKLLGRVTFTAPYEGPPGQVHGSLVAAVYDQIMAFVTIVVQQTGGPTATLTVDYLKPTPLGEPLVFSCWIDKVDGRKIHVLGECHHGDTLVSRSRAIFILYQGNA